MIAFTVISVVFIVVVGILGAILILCARRPLPGLLHAAVLIGALAQFVALAGPAVLHIYRATAAIAKAHLTGPS